MLSSNIEELKATFCCFYEISGIVTSLYDRDFNRIYGYPEHYCAFCECWRSSPEREALCKESDMCAFNTCRKSNSSLIYTCHLGLTEVIVPISRGSTILGYLLIGQMLSTGKRESIVNNIESSKLSSTLAQQLISSLDSVVLYDSKKIGSFAKIAEMCACYLMVQEVVDIKSSILSQEIMLYINAHVFEHDLSLEKLCRVFYISRTSLYNLIHDFMPSGFRAYLTHKRLEEAKKLLADGASVADTATRIGFSDSNYFVKVFKAEYSITPKDYAICQRKRIKR